MAVLLMDIDHFKYYNDEYGHPAGDECLRAVAQAMNAQIHRPDDAVCRYGGEEFCCILPETDTNGARHIAALMQEAVHQLAIAHKKSPVAPYVTISIGIASVTPDDDRGVDTLISMADNNLYKAKTGGRARIEGGEAEEDSLDGGL